MRVRLIGALAAGAALLVSAVVAVPAAAQPATWTVSPGGAFHGVAGETLLETLESGIQFGCASSTLDGEAPGGTGLSNPLASFPETPGITLNDCSGPFGIVFEIDPVGEWHFNGASYDGSDVTTGTIDDLQLDVVAPGCNASLSGSLDATYTNSTGTLKVLPNFTVVFSYVDPVNNCLGIINTGDHASLNTAYVLSPGLTITSP
jgi:hypothetical protein